MMDDKELVEVWMSQFQSDLKKHDMQSFPFEKKPNGLGYADFNIDTLWTGFLLAKRSQPSVVLPQPDDIYDSGYIWQGRYYHEGIVTNSLTAAGIKYTIKE